MAEQSAVTRVYQHPGRAVNEIGIAVVGSHGLPNEGIKVVEYVHNICFTPLFRGMDIQIFEISSVESSVLGYQPVSLNPSVSSIWIDSL